MRKKIKRRITILSLYTMTIALTAILLSVFIKPLTVWYSKESIPLNIWIIDKTVPTPQYREHKGFTWLLNSNNIVYSKTGKAFDYTKDFYGFVPLSEEEYQTRELPSEKENPDIIYLTDTYGVYRDDYLKPNLRGTSSSLVYGGLNEDDLKKIRSNLGNGNTLIGEFNIASSPTNDKNRTDLGQLFGVKWNGWKGKYFHDLKKNIEVPESIINAYEKNNSKWDYSGSGYVLVSDNSEVVVLKDGEQVGKEGLSIKFIEPYDKLYGIKNKIQYLNWFEFTEVENKSRVEANFIFDLTEKGIEELKKLGLNRIFPAVVVNENHEYNSYYFSGDFTDIDVTNKLWKFSGFDKLKRITTQVNKKNEEYFYWNCYAPMMNKILQNSKKLRTSYNIEEEMNTKLVAKTIGDKYYVYSKGKWEKTLLKGVNLGVGKPGSFPGELAITKEEYIRWFKYIGDMNCNVIRVYTTQKPDFYDALYLYNLTAKNPIYLLQGVWVKEEDIVLLNDAYAENEKILNEFLQDGKDLVDIIHGNTTLPVKQGFASGEYRNDVSKYVIGWVLGIEWDPNFVQQTNIKNTNRAEYSGKYLYTSGATPFEAFLCKVGDKLTEYEVTNYNMVRPISYTNWLTTDMLKHPNEPYPKEDMAVVNVENIKPKESFAAGIFASYHVYPYYPEFMNYQKEYANFIDENGKVNSYKAYLRDLKSKHNIPVLVAEFGIPASRGIAHINTTMGYNQGNHDEVEQGNILKNLFIDIVDENYCGGLIFTWQDEWFKRTWNTMDFDLPDRRPYWSNPQTNEQQFGLLAFDPGKDKSIAYVDGDVSDWNINRPIFYGDNIKLYVKSDEKYVYLMADVKDFDFKKDKLIIPIDTIENQGNTSIRDEKSKFSRASDFLIIINGEDNSKIVVDAYYDSFYYLYAEKLNMQQKNPHFIKKNSGIFNPEYLCLSREIYLPEEKKTIPFIKYETGKLKYGNGNPHSANFNSLSDFCYGNGKVEIRIPWQLLNTMDPSTRVIINDFYKNNGIKGESSEGFYFGAGIKKANEGIEIKNMGLYKWSTWEKPTYHERLKESYYIIQEVFKNIK